MPELPEVETIRSYLAPLLEGQTFKEVEVLSKKQFPNSPAKVLGQKIVSTSRHGKNLFLHLSGGSLLHFHLKMTGQLLFKSAASLNQQKSKTPPDLSSPHPVWDVSFLPNRYTRIIFRFSSADTLFFNDLRKFGWAKIISSKTHEKLISSLGPDWAGDSLTVQALFLILAASKRPIKILLLDQTKVAGIGNIYVSEALFLADIHPSTPANTLSLLQVKKLHHSLKDVVQAAILAQGTSAADEAYILPNGEKGTYQKKAYVYHREGKKCKKCSAKIKNYKLGGRSTFYCPFCQPLPKLP